MGNHEIQARIDIEQHYDWDEYKRNYHLAYSIIKDAITKDIDVINNDELKSYIAKECNICIVIFENNIILAPIVKTPSIEFLYKEN